MNDDWKIGKNRSHFRRLPRFEIQGSLSFFLGSPCGSGARGSTNNEPLWWDCEANNNIKWKWKSSFTPQIPSSSMEDQHSSFAATPFRTCAWSAQATGWLDVSALAALGGLFFDGCPWVTGVGFCNSVTGKRTDYDEAMPELHKPELHKQEIDVYINSIVLYEWL